MDGEFEFRTLVKGATYYIYVYISVKVKEGSQRVSCFMFVLESPNTTYIQQVFNSQLRQNIGSPIVTICSSLRGSMAKEAE